MCCQAAGGDPLWAEDLTAAWFLFYQAAQIMDHVEDRDPPESWWFAQGPGLAVNAASGLYFTASLILQDLYTSEATRPAADDIVGDFYSSLFKMCSGQHRDLVQSQPTLEQCWGVAGAKSGTFFALACRAGARLATGKASRLEGFGIFGRQLGLLVQVLDDLEEVLVLQEGGRAGQEFRFERSLAVAYALEVLPPSQRLDLGKALRGAMGDNSCARQAFQWIDRSGAGLYLMTEIERLRQGALDALKQAEPCSPAKEALLSLLDQKTLF